MKKICIVVTIPATIINFVLDIAKYLHNEKGYDVTVMCDRDDNFKELLPDYIHYIPIPMSRGINLSGFKAIKKFRKVFKQEKFDLVQYATPNASFYASMAAKKECIPIRLYGQWGMRYVGFSGIKRKLFKFLEKIVCNNSTHIFAVSPMNMEFAIDEKLYSRDKVRVVGNGGTIGVDMKAYDIGSKEAWRNRIRGKYAITQSTFLFGFAGRIAADKGCKELLFAFKELSQTNANVKLLIIGPAEEDTGVDEDLWSWAKNSDRVIFTGRVNNADMKEYYAAIDILVHPTYREGFGMVIQEAGALAIPVITTKIPGASEVMVEDESCILVNPRDAEALKVAMLKAVEDRELVIRLGKAAYERTQKLYDRPIMLKNQKEAFESLLEN